MNGIENSGTCRLPMIGGIPEGSIGTAIETVMIEAAIEVGIRNASAAGEGAAAGEGKGDGSEDGPVMIEAVISRDLDFICVPLFHVHPFLGVVAG